MDEGDLENAGVPLGHRKKILHHLGKLPSPRHVYVATVSPVVLIVAGRM